MSAPLFSQYMDNPYSAPQGQIYTPTGAQAPLTWKQILFSFEGRIPRRTYWGFTLLATGAFYALLFILMAILGEDTGTIVAIVLWIPMVWCGLAISAKRWHDRDKSAWWILIALIPFIGGIWTFIECGCLRGTEGGNRYGEDPT
jgi:uncharacterized membrane protein YhaH (DUF805 family)